MRQMKKLSEIAPKSRLTHLDMVDPYRIGLREGREANFGPDPGPWSVSPGAYFKYLPARLPISWRQRHTVVLCVVELAKSQSPCKSLQESLQVPASRCKSPCNSSLQGYWHSLWPTRHGPHCDLPSSVLGRSCAGSCAGWSSRRWTRRPCATAATWSIFAASSARSAASSCAPRACCTRRTCCPRTGASALAASGT